MKTRTRLSTTVDTDLLMRARTIHAGDTDASLVEAALTLLLKRHRDDEIDAEYARAYADTPGTVDAWGDLNEWLDDAARRPSTNAS